MELVEKLFLELVVRSAMLGGDVRLPRGRSSSGREEEGFPPLPAPNEHLSRTIVRLLPRTLRRVEQRAETCDVVAAGHEELVARRHDRNRLAQEVWKHV